MRYTPEHKQRTHDRILKAAAKEIRTEGPHRVALTKVMTKVGLTHGGFYAHFASKDELVAAAIRQMFDESYEKLIRETEARPPGEALYRYLDFYLSTWHRETRTAGCPLPFLSTDAPRLSKAARGQVVKEAERLTAILARKIEGLGLPYPEEEARAVLAQLVGAISLARAEPDKARSEAILAASRGSLLRRLGLSEFQEDAK